MSRLREELAGLLVDMQIADDWHKLYSRIRAASDSNDEFEWESPSNPTLARTGCVERWEKHCARFTDCALPSELFSQATHIIQELEDKLAEAVSSGH